MRADALPPRALLGRGSWLLGQHLAVTSVALPMFRTIYLISSVAILVSCGACPDGSQPDDNCTCGDAEKTQLEPEECRNGDDGSGSSESKDDLPTGCTDLGQVDESVEFDGTASDSSDEIDFYCFEVSGISGLTVSMVGAFAVADIFPYADAVTNSDSLGQTFNGAGAWDLPPGRYALRVSVSGFGGGEYDVALAAEDHGLSDADEDADERGRVGFEVSTKLGHLEGYVGLLDREDFYAVDVPSGSELSVELQHVGVAGTITLALADQAEIPSFGVPELSVSAGANAVLPQPITPGTKLISVSGSGAYRISAALVATDE